ncbi:hypothetical protein BJ138DRAFT_1138521 [Hygrophoropsis aurantiaca]|uniref:Uncharacterized protein n=1 Tax=Hygrophoropsis aurantiaca TaxID=72124 RepID=A0ACB7ZU00_9AGAM|nr:hypothetical protein BJ138DRAFT_1138521 [Hygrophoropsis aurantiaca]
MGLQECWDINHPERIKAQSRISHKLFYKAVDDVERLVVMRLLELTKLQISGIGYKLRTQISAALRTCATAIKNALAQYNTYAAQLDPPRPKLEWEEIVEYSFLGEFDLLRESGEHLQSKRWANPTHRLAAVQYFGKQRAEEEIARCNIHDDAIDMPKYISKIHTTNAPLATELRRRWKQLQSVNTQHLSWISQIQNLPGYSGPKGPGIRIGRSLSEGFLDNAVQPDDGVDAGDNSDHDNLDSDRIGSIQDFLHGLDSHCVDNEC